MSIDRPRATCAPSTSRASPRSGAYARGLPAIDGAAGLRDWIRANRYSIPHVVGTCAMGPSPEDGAVVDARGRVHGAERLHVVDASIMPDVPSGFTHVSTIMIAERLSEQIASSL